MEDRYRDLLPELLLALKWKGRDRDIAEAMPYGAEKIDMLSFRALMINLGYASRIGSGKRPERLFYPAVGIMSSGLPVLLLSQDDLARHKDGFLKFLTFRPAEPKLIPINGVLSLRREFLRYKPVLSEVFLISVIITVFALAPVLFNRTLYDHVIASGSTYGLTMLSIGTVVALGVEYILRERRGYRLAAFAGRLDHYVSSNVMERLLFLPPAYTERSAVSAQVARLKDFENVREFFTGPLATLFFEMPMILIYLAVIGMMAHWLVLVPLALLACYLLLFLAIDFRLKENSRIAAAAGSKRQEFLMESVAKMHDIRLAGLETVWNERCRTVSGEASIANFRSAYTAQILETCSYVLMNASGIAMLGFGVHAVIEGHLTIGALIASMMLIWRIVAPMQICCASITRLQQLQASVRQVGRLLSMPPEHVPHVLSTAAPAFRGQVTFNRVSLRYSQDAEPALLGVSFEIQPGQVVAIRGGNGSGKSTILKMVLGLYRPQSGSVRIDGVDIRQYDPVMMRQMISYVPQNVDLFPGTIRENILFANPAADEDRCWQALHEACAAEEVRNLPSGLDTIIEGAEAETISYQLKQRLNLARAYIRPAPVMLFDEASHSLGLENDRAFEEKIRSLRGRSTVILVTHREDHMRLADQLFVMQRGELTHAGSPDQVLTVLKGK